MVIYHSADELDDRLRGPAKNVTVLATAFSSPEKRGTGENEPMLMDIRFGKGRVFHTTLGHAARRPDAKKRRATTSFAPEYVEVLSFWRYGKLRDDLKIHDFFFALARLGGHQNRRGDHRPDWLILWRGWVKLQHMLDGYLAAQRKKVG